MRRSRRVLDFLNKRQTLILGVLFLAVYFILLKAWYDCRREQILGRLPATDTPFREDALLHLQSLGCTVEFLANEGRWTSEEEMAVGYYSVGHHLSVGAFIKRNPFPVRGVYISEYVVSDTTGDPYPLYNVDILLDGYCIQFRSLSQENKSIFLEAVSCLVEKAQEELPGVVRHKPAY